MRTIVYLNYLDSLHICVNIYWFPFFSQLPTQVQWTLLRSVAGITINKSVFKQNLTSAMIKNVCADLLTRRKGIKKRLSSLDQKL